MRSERGKGHPSPLNLNPPDYVRRRVALRERDAYNAAAARFDGLASDDAVCRPIRAFHEHVELKTIDEAVRVILIEQDDGVHAPERGQNFRALGFGIDGSRWSFDGLHGTIAVQPYDERIAFVPCLLKISDVARMKNVEHAVGKYDGAPLMTQMCHPGDNFGERQHFLTHVRAGKACEFSKQCLFVFP